MVSGNLDEGKRAIDAGEGGTEIIYVSSGGLFRRWTMRNSR